MVVTARNSLLSLILIALCIGVLEARPHRLARSARLTKKSPATSASSSQNNDLFSVVIDGKARKNIHLLRINAIRYCAFQSLSQNSLSAASPAQKKKSKKLKVQAGQETQRSNAVQISQHRIRTSAGSFFVAAESEERAVMAQMTVPAIQVGGTLLVPYPQFFTALSTLGLCTINEKESSVQWIEQSKRPQPDITKKTNSEQAINPLTPLEEENKSTKSSKSKINSKSKSSSPLLTSDQEGSAESPDESSTSKKKPNLNAKDARKESVKKLNNKTTDSGDIESSPVPTSAEPEPVAPMRYQLPGDLKRRELEDSTSSNKQSSLDKKLIRTSDEVFSSASFAAFGTMFLARPARITSISTEVQGSSTRIHLHADKDLAEIPEPEIDGSTLRIVLPDCINALKDLAVLRKLNVESVKASREESSLVYTLVLKSSERQVQLEQVDSRHLIYTISPKSKQAPASTAHKKWSLDCIVIDAGHGGKDVGAESINGHYEKDIALKVALKLRDEIKKKLPQTKVVLTRSTDVFVELDKRGEIANKAGGKLFISIHCNSTPTRPTKASGFETYVLSPAKTNTAVEVAKRENAVIQLEEKSDRYKGLNDDQLIVATLAQNSFVKLSSTFAALVQKNMQVCTNMCERSVNQAGFIVLIGASMPAVLVEIGFVTNANDEKVLTTSAGQLKIAKGISEAVRQYSATYSKMLKI